MMKNSKDRSHGPVDHVMDRFRRARHSFQGAWRCRPCAGDYISPSPRPHKKPGQKEATKPDISKDPLFIKPSRPIPAREDDRLAVEGHEEGDGKKNSQSHRGKIDGQLQSASQQDVDEHKSQDEERNAADSQAHGGKINGEFQKSSQKVENGAADTQLQKGQINGQINGQLQPTTQPDEDLLKPQGETVGQLEKGDKISSRMGHPKTGSSDLFDLPSSVIVSGEGAAEQSVDGVPVHHFDPLKIEAVEDSSTANSTRPSFPADQYGTGHLESSSPIKSGLNINIPSSEKCSLDEEACEKVKALEENESPVSVLQGIPDLETPKAEDKKVGEAWKEGESHQSGQGIPKLDPANNVTHSCAVSKPETAQLEYPFEDVQTNSSEIANPGEELGTHQADADSFHQTEDQKKYHLLQGGPNQDSKSRPEGSNDFGVNEAQRAGNGNEKHSLQIPGNYHSMGSKNSNFREAGSKLEGGSLHNAEDEKVDGGLGETKQESFSNSGKLEELLAGSTLHGIAAASIQGTGEDGSSQLYPDHPAYTELRPNSHHGQENAQEPPLHREESNSFKIGIFSVPHVLVVGAITVVSLLGKAASN